MLRKVWAVLLFLFSSTVFSQSMPRTFMLDAKKLVELKTAFAGGDQHTVAAIASVCTKADAMLGKQPRSVMDKGFTPVSGSKHDYMSQAPYFWYDSSKPNGRPYIRRDGERNPEINRIEDHKHLDELEEAVTYLSLAFYFTEQEKYAVKAAALLRHWFLNADSKMNPNLNYAQGIPGITDGRGIGLIETRSLINIGDAVGLLKTGTAWTDADDNGIHHWYKEFLQWMLTSKNGKEERAAKNNHGTWYNAQALHFALFTGDEKLARDLADESRARLDSQVTAEGKMPLELERTTALGYSIFNLVAWHKLATLAAQAGVDLWNYRTTKNAGIRTAIDWLLPFATGERKWEYQQINPFSKAELYELLLYAYRNYRNPTYLAAARATGQSGRDPFFDLVMLQP